MSQRVLVRTVSSDGWEQVEEWKANDKTVEIKLNGTKPSPVWPVQCCLSQRMPNGGNGKCKKLTHESSDSYEEVSDDFVENERIWVRLKDETTNGGKKQPTEISIRVTKVST